LSELIFSCRTILIGGLCAICWRQPKKFVLTAAGAEIPPVGVLTASKHYARRLERNIEADRGVERDRRGKREVA